MRVDHRCRRVRRRLPLLAGGELGVEERRAVERHLIGCPGCRGRLDASADALSALRSSAEGSPAKADAPSLWPSLALQIRQSRHDSPRPSRWEQILAPRPWAVFSLATSLGVILAAAIVKPADRGEDAAIAQPLDRGEDEVVPPLVVTTQAPTVDVEPNAPTPSRPSQGGALPEGPPRQVAGASQSPVKPIEPPSTIFRFDYDLDHGTPMGPGNRDPQRTF